MNKNYQNSNLIRDIISKIFKLNYKDLIIFLIPFIIFSYYLFVYNPGILTVDSLTQLHQIATGEFTTWHPFFHTFIMMLCLYLYPSASSVALFQICVFSVMWVIICKYFRDDKNEKLNKIFLLQVAVTLIISLIPINAIYSITLWKDILFSYCMLFLCFLIKVMLDKKCQLNWTFVIIISLMMACIVQLRHNGIYVILPMLVILGVYLFKKNKKQNVYLVIPALTILFILLFGSLNIIYDVQNNDHDAVFSKVSHMLADYDLNLDLSESDRNKIHELMPEDEIRENYDIYLSDTISYNANQTPFDNNKMEYITMAIKYSLTNPIHFINYIFESSAMVWDITRDDDWQGEPYYHVSKNTAEYFFEKYSLTPVAPFENVSCINDGTDSFNQLDSFVTFSKENIIFDTVFNSPALYMYLSIILLILIHFITKSKNIYLVYLPNLINIIGIFISTPIQDNRYLYPNLLVFYLLVIILIGILVKRNYDDHAIKQMPDKKSLDKNFSNFENNFKVEKSEDYFSINQKFDRKKIETPEEMERRIRSEILRELDKKQNDNSHDLRKR